METIKVYETDDVGVSRNLVALETFIGDVDGKNVGIVDSDNCWTDDGIIDAGDAVTAINGLVSSLENRDKEIERLRAMPRELVACFCTVRGGWDYAKLHRLLEQAKISIEL